MKVVVSRPMPGMFPETLNDDYIDPLEIGRFATDSSNVAGLVPLGCSAMRLRAGQKQLLPPEADPYRQSGRLGTARGFRLSR